MALFMSRLRSAHREKKQKQNQTTSNFNSGKTTLQTPTQERGELQKEEILFKLKPNLSLRV